MLQDSSRGDAAVGKPNVKEPDAEKLLGISGDNVPSAHTHDEDDNDH